MMNTLSDLNNYLFEQIERMTEHLCCGIRLVSSTSC